MKRYYISIFFISSLIFSYSLPDFLQNNITTLKARLYLIYKEYQNQKIIINASNPHRTEVASVRTDVNLPYYELGTVRKRLDKAHISLEKFLNTKLERNKVPQIGIAFSGGGYRAMILSLGYSLGLQKIGLFDSALYMSMLSGSTWFGSKLIYSGSIEKVKAKDLASIKIKQFDLVSMQRHMASHPQFLVNNVIWPKFLFGQSVTTIDLYGALLSDALYSSFSFAKKPKYLSEQKEYLIHGALPYPIYTAVRAKERGYDWAELTPDHFKLTEQQKSIPIWAFGRRFENNKSVDFAPEQTMGYFAGMFGSAYTVNLGDIKRIALDGIVKDLERTQGLEKIKYATAATVIKLLSELKGVGQVRLSPAQLPNPFYGDVHESSKNMVLVDAGIDYNLPLAPLMQKNRNLDLIIVGDASGNIASGAELQKFFSYAKKQYGLTYKRTDDKAYQNFGVYKADKKAPVIVYLNFMNDKKMVQKFIQDPTLGPLIKTYALDTFDPQTCGYCSTINFDYSTQNYTQLSTVGEFAVRAHEQVIRNVIEDIVVSKKNESNK